MKRKKKNTELLSILCSSVNKSYMKITKFSAMKTDQQDQIVVLTKSSLTRNTSLTRETRKIFPVFKEGNCNCQKIFSKDFRTSANDNFYYKRKGGIRLLSSY